MEIDNIKKLFGKEASNYTKFRKSYPQELYDLIFSLIPENSKKILDIACGTGKSTEPLTESGLEVYGCDHDRLMIDEALKEAKLKKLSINYSVTDVEHLHFADEYFDVITVGTAFHFFVNEKAISEIKRVLKKGGLLCIFWTLSTKDIPEKDEIPSEIYRSYGWIKIPSELRDIDHTIAFLEKNGLAEVDSARIPFSYNTTIEERVGLQTTSGSFELFSEENKKKFLEEIRNTLTKKLGDRPYFTLEEEIQVCYGFKE